MYICICIIRYVFSFLTSLYKVVNVFPGIEFFALIFFADNCQPLSTVLFVIYKYANPFLIIGLLLCDTFGNL
jgi:hypothetical protein